MTILILLFSFIYSFLAILYEIDLIKKTKSLTISSLIGFLFIFTYGVLPFLVIYSYKFKSLSISSTYSTYDYSEDGLMNTIFWQILGILAYMIFKRMSISAKKDVNVYKKTYNKTALQITTVISMIIGLLSIYLWSKAYGGIFELIKVANSVRGGWSDVVNTFAFFKHPSRLVLISSFSSLLLIKNDYRKGINIIIFLISFLSSILFILATDGRLNFCLYFVIIAFIHFDLFDIEKESDKKIVKLIFLTVICFVFIINLNAITKYLRHGIYENDSASSILPFILNEFSYVMISGQTAFQHASTGHFLIIDDFFYGIMAWIPSSLKPFQCINIWDYNTSLTTRGGFGQFPCDFVTASLYDLSYLGPIAFGFIWGTIVNKIEKLRESSSLFHIICYYSLCLTCLRLVNYCMLYSFILSIFALFIFVLVYNIITIIMQRGR